MIALFTLAIFSLGPGLGVALAVHLHEHETPHHHHHEGTCKHHEGSHEHQQGSHDSSSCFICVQLTTSAKSPTIQVTSLLIVSDGPAVVEDIPDHQIYTSRGFSAASPRAPPLT